MKPKTKQFISRAGTLLVVSLLLLALASQGALSQPTVDHEEPVVGESSAQAPSSTLLSYQGTLTDEQGNPVTAPVTMQFALHDASTGGNLKWGPETQSVQVTDGLFNVLLGSVTAIDPANLTGDLWLDIIVNGEQLTPRERITTVPYAMEAGTLPAGAETQGSLDVYRELRVVSPAVMSAFELMRTDEEDRTHRWRIWHMNEEYGMNSLQIWEYRTDSIGEDCNGNAADGAICAPRFTIAQGGNVGIGVMEPLQPLHLEYDKGVTAGEHILASLMRKNPGAGVILTYHADGSATTAGAVRASIGHDLYLGTSNYPNAIAIRTANGNVGIGVASPLVPLHLEHDSGVTAGAHNLASLLDKNSGAGVVLGYEADGTVATAGRVRASAGYDLHLGTSSYLNAITILNTSGTTRLSGNLDMNGNSAVNCGALTEANLQTPEELAAGGSDRFEEGDVLCWGIDQLELCATPNDRLVQAVADAGGRPIVIGAEVVKVLGPVARGDILVASRVPGYAMVNNDPVSGSVIAQALEDFDRERGIIKAMIRKW